MMSCAKLLTAFLRVMQVTKYFSSLLARPASDNIKQRSTAIAAKHGQTNSKT